MDEHGWFVCAVILAVIVALSTNRVAVDVAMLSALTILLVGDQILGGILTLEDAAAGFANPVLLLIGSLFVIAAALERTGGIEKLARILLGCPQSERGAIARLTIPVALMSALMNNTPLVAMYLSIVQDWAKRLRVSTSRLYMPLSFAAILGGKLTLFGTASNMIVMSLYEKYVGDLDAVQRAGYELSQREEFWGVAKLGAPTTIVGLLFMVVAARWVLPLRKPVDTVSADGRSFSVEMVIEETSLIHGKTVQEAGLRQLPGLFLAHIEREGEVRVAGRNLLLEVGDRLGFVGNLESVLDLRKIRGLAPIDEEKSRARHGTVLVEVVVSARSSLVGRTVRGSNFRARYNAAIWAVHRHGEKLAGKIGGIRLRAGDTLLLECRPGGASALKNNPDFYLASAVQQSEGIRHDRANIALAILLCVVFAITLFDVPAALAALVGAGLTVATRCIRSGVARSSVNWQILIVIGSAWSLGTAMSKTGVAEFLAHGVMGMFPLASPTWMIFVLFLLTAGFAQLITNNGAAVLMFPVAMRVAQEFSIHPHAILFTLMVAAGSTFLSPISYQTNLMVYGPGGYRFTDFFRLGAPLTILLAVTCALIAPRAY